MDYNKLKGTIPNVVLAEIPLVIQKFEINTDLRLCHFLSQKIPHFTTYISPQIKDSYGTEGG
jgi:hypothetical protein